jgi:RHS repeat-associated protein
VQVQAGHTTPCYDADYYPFGGERMITDNCDSAYKFTGKERDTESGLDNFGARFDSSSLGRFMSPDIGRFHLIDPQSLNRYAYVGNNPLVFFDPDGLEKYSYWLRLGGFIQTNLVSIGDPVPLVPLAVLRKGIGASPRSSSQPGRPFDMDKGQYPNAGAGVEVQWWKDNGNKVNTVYVTFTIDMQTNVDKDGSVTTTTSIVSASITWGPYQGDEIGNGDLRTQINWAGKDPNTQLKWNADLSQLSDEQLAAVRSAVASNPRASFLNPFLSLIDQEIERRQGKRRRLEEEQERDKKNNS